MIPLGLNKALASVSPGPQSPAPLPSWAGCSIPLPQGQLSYTHVLHKWTQQTIKRANCSLLAAHPRPKLAAWNNKVTACSLALALWIPFWCWPFPHAPSVQEEQCTESHCFWTRDFFHSGLGSSSSCSAEQMAGRAGSLSPQAVTSPESRDTKTTASICVRASPGGFGAGSGQCCCSQISRERLITMGGTKPRANSFPRMWLWRNCILASAQVTT